MHFFPLQINYFPSRRTLPLSTPLSAGFCLVSVLRSAALIAHYVDTAENQRLLAGGAGSKDKSRGTGLKETIKGLLLLGGSESESGATGQFFFSVFESRWIATNQPSQINVNLERNSSACQRGTCALCKPACVFGLRSFVIKDASVCNTSAPLWKIAWKALWWVSKHWWLNG